MYTLKKSRDERTGRTKGKLKFHRRALFTLNHFNICSRRHRRWSGDHLRNTARSSHHRRWLGRCRTSNQLTELTAPSFCFVQVKGIPQRELKRSLRTGRGQFLRV